MNAVQIVLIVLVVLLMIAYPILVSRRNKKANEQIQQQTNSLKRGDEILTTSGVYGTVLEVKQDGEAKKVVIETGSSKNKSYMMIDAYSIYTVLNKEKESNDVNVEKQEIADDKKPENSVEKEEK